MKEIVNRLHENRQIELAKSILENAGYKVEKIEENTQKTYYINYLETEGKFKGKHVDKAYQANSEKEAEDMFKKEHPDLKKSDYKITGPDNLSESEDDIHNKMEIYVGDTFNVKDIHGEEYETTIENIYITGLHLSKPDVFIKHEWISKKDHRTGTSTHTLEVFKRDLLGIK